MLLLTAALSLITTDLKAHSHQLHPDGYFGNDLAVGAYFEWLLSLKGDPHGFKFYPGVGPDFYFRNCFDLAAAGNFGVVYSFLFPLTIGFDWRHRFILTEQFRFKGTTGAFLHDSASEKNTDANATTKSLFHEENSP